MKSNTPPHLKPLLFLASIALACFGCASAPASDYDVPNPVTSPQSPAVMRDAEMCLKTGPCTVLQVENGNWADARLYINGNRFGYAPSMSHTTLFLPRWRLDNAGCAVIAVHLLAGDWGKSDKVCVQPGDYLNLDIDHNTYKMPLHVWLNPRRG